MIGIDSNSWLVYEGQSRCGHGLWPPPVLSVATPVQDETDYQLVPDLALQYEAKLLFREDSFDPVTRVRRGRLYAASSQQPQQWNIRPNFFVRMSAWEQVNLYTFESHRLRDDRRESLLALGTQSAFTIWRIVSAEQILTGEDLVTLKSRTSLGILPELDLSAIPELGRAKVQQTISILADGAYRSGPESVIDRARDVAQWCLGTWLADQEKKDALRHEDLGSLLKKIHENRTILKSIGATIARLHSRAKPNEQDRHGTRPIMEEDAEFAIAAVGMLLRELRWAK